MEPSDFGRVRIRGEEFGCSAGPGGCQSSQTMSWSYFGELIVITVRVYVILHIHFWNRFSALQYWSHTTLFQSRNMGLRLKASCSPRWWSWNQLRPHKPKQWQAFQVGETYWDMLTIRLPYLNVSLGKAWNACSIQCLVAKWMKHGLRTLGSSHKRTSMICSLPMFQYADCCGISGRVHLARQKFVWFDWFHHGHGWLNSPMLPLGTTRAANDFHWCIYILRSKLTTVGY